MPPSTVRRSSKPPSGRYLSFAEREEIALLRAQGHGVREVAKRLGRAASTVSRELRRNTQRQAGVPGYDGAVACRASSAAPETGEVADNPKAESLCARPVGIDAEEVARFIEPAALVVAHNARFDRRFAERFCDAFAAKP